MHPAPSIILFTVSSGAGYGLMLLFSLLSLIGVLPPDQEFGAVTLFIALGLQALGLLSSTFHLKHPERAWRALSQWRSSWLSREGVVAILTFIPGGLWFLALAFDQPIGPWATVFAASTVVGALVVVSCTAMIYGSLKTIRQWHHRMVPVVYHMFALQTGALLLLFLAIGFGYRGQLLWIVAILAAAAAWVVKQAYWRAIDAGTSASTASTATGLEGRVRLSDPPHTEENYLLTEMGFSVARKHAAKLRRWALILGAVLPIAILCLTLFLFAELQLPLAAMATGFGLLGAAVERWLFFAEATHTVTLYYGAETA